MNNRVLLILTALFAFITDQASKLYVVHVMHAPLRGEIPVIPPFLNFRYLENRGINFGLFGGGSEASRWILVLIGCLVIGGILFFIRDRLWHKPTVVFAALLIGGALGNIIDRIYQGFVTDFINNSLPNWNNPFSYNIADIWVFIGIFGLIFFEPKKDQN